MPALDREAANRRYYQKHYRDIRTRMHFNRTGCKCGHRFGVLCKYDRKAHHTAVEALKRKGIYRRKRSKKRIVLKGIHFLEKKILTKR